MVDRNEPQGLFGLRIVGLANPPAGNVSTYVLRFANNGTREGSAALADWLTITTTAQLGTVLQIRKRGIYRCKLAMVSQAPGELVAGITLDAAAGDLIATPSWTMASLQARAGAFTTASGEPAPITRATWECGEDIPVTQAMINAGLGIIRAHAGSGPGGPPISTPQVTPTECAFIIRCIADLPGS